MDYAPICCPRRRTFDNQCKARCAGVDPNTCRPGDCQIIIPAPKLCSQPEAFCFKDPCSQSECPGHLCRSHNCNKDVNLFGVEVGPCVPVYVNQKTGVTTVNTCPP
eukprot:TRINITY_DN2003_c0_g1_i5.p5 TRINITY_DN2003_c0_g1~~TRINITY_DN2003_c0_g1_i5.p5  ORF type:complete len:106 (-),score=0.49 TRINITY_DN2003_c0_g1_i5:460-777(-)